ncbi:MAG TPA: hypothetical protein VNA32_00275 [Actinomycetota bacterium]|nr:hypothetical protein [Actinomycetota bacterium]
MFELADGRLMVYTDGRYLSPGYMTQWSPMVAWLPAKVLVAK